MRLAAAPVTPAFQAPTIVRMRPNAITAVAIPRIVSAVRRRCRKRFLKASRRSFTAGPSLEFALVRSEEHTSELQSQSNLVCRLLLEKKKNLVHEHSCAGDVNEQ